MLLQLSGRTIKLDFQCKSYVFPTSSWVGILRLATQIAPSLASLQDYTESEYKTST